MAPNRLYNGIRGHGNDHQQTCKQNLTLITKTMFNRKRIKKLEKDLNTIRDYCSELVEWINTIHLLQDQVKELQSRVSILESRLKSNHNNNTNNTTNHTPGKKGK